jgi:16S rRNA (guanine527-N7)-methyltransferase
VTLTEHLLVNKDRGAQARILAMKGLLPAEELARIPDSVTIGKVVKVNVPGCEGERHIIELLGKSAE